jgi:hypothetical protein
MDSSRGGHLARRPTSWHLIRLTPPPTHHLKVLTSSSSPYRPHLHPTCRTNWKLRSVRNLMASAGRLNSHILLSDMAPLQRAWECSSSISPPRFPSPSFPGSISPPSLLSVFHLALRTLLLLLCVFHPRSSTALAMPRLRGKSRRGKAWYAARGKEVPNSDPPPENEAIPILAPILAPTPTEPLREATPDLSPLSNPYSDRVEWFDTLGNSLGYAPSPPSPPRRPPPPPSPSRHQAEATSAPSPLPSSSSDSPLCSTCDRC